MENEKREFRKIVEIRAGSSEDDRIIRGTAIVFNKESRVLGRWDQFTEIIKPEAVTQDLINKSDILMLYNHDDDGIPMARSKYGSGTLKIILTATGVDFEFEARKTPQGDEILAAVRSGDVDSCSFAFITADDGDTWFMKPDNTMLRTITKFEDLQDFSLVTKPAYLETSCRSLDKFKESRNEPPAPPAPVTPPPAPATPPADPPAPDPIDEYYAGIDATVEKLKSVDGSYPDTPAGVEAYYKELDASVQQIAEPPAES